MPELFGEEMQLSEAQKQEIAELRVAAMMERRQQRSEMRGNRSRGGQQGRMQRGDRQQQAQGYRMGRNGLPDEIMDVLTPAQQERFAEMQQEREAQRETMRTYMVQARVQRIATDLSLDEVTTQELEKLVMAHHSEMRAARQQGPSEAARENHRRALLNKIEADFGAEVSERWAEKFQPGSPRSGRGGGRR